MWYSTCANGFPDVSCHSAPNALMEPTSYERVIVGNFTNWFTSLKLS